MPKPKERPIIFSGPMVRAILDGRKTQTRRVVKPQPTRHLVGGQVMWGHEQLGGQFGDHVFGACATQLLPCPFGKPGDLLWVRERARLVETDTGSSWTAGVREDARVRVRYEADGTESGWLPYPTRLAGMPLDCCIPGGCYREASRLTLRITDVRVQRLQEISEEDAIAEGVFDEKRDDGELPSTIFRAYWHHLNGKKPGASWNDNPWVWVYTFEQVTDA